MIRLSNKLHHGPHVALAHRPGKVVQRALGVEQHGECTRDDQRRGEVPDDYGCPNDVEQKCGNFRGGSRVDGTLAGVYEVRADDHCRQRQ